MNAELTKNETWLQLLIVTQSPKNNYMLFSKT